MFENSYWIWNKKSEFDKNSFCRFRKIVEFDGKEKANINITADSRYYLFVNGLRVGSGPIRSYPNHYSYDTFSIAEYLKPGKNVISVLVNHFGLSTFQYLLRDGGLLIEGNIGGDKFFSDKSFKADNYVAYNTNAPRIDTQMQFEEQFDANFDDNWKELNYNDELWQNAVELRAGHDGQHNNFTQKTIPNLTQEIKTVKSVVEVAKVINQPFVISFDFQKFVNNFEYSCTPIAIKYAVAVEIFSLSEQVRQIIYNEWVGDLKINDNSCIKSVSLKKGRNILFFKGDDVFHTMQRTLVFDDKTGLTVGKIFITKPFKGKIANNVLGVYNEYLLNIDDESFLKLCAKLNCGDFDDSNFIDISSCLHTSNVFAKVYNEQVETRDDVNLANLVGEDFAEINCNNQDTRLLVDFGQELVGNISFDCIAEKGTQIDFFGFEFIQADGLRNYTEGLNNSFLYKCKQGFQSYVSIIRRGFRYLYITVRNCQKLYLKKLRVVFSTYPQLKNGQFECSDYKINKIVANCKNTLRCCMEDTYTDCPTYEQTHWVGDMRNEALIDWVSNGDSRLWFHCLQQVGESLEISPLVLSQVPSGWWNILPSWMCLWMISVGEYSKYTGDKAGTLTLISFLKKNFIGIKQHINSDNLFAIEAWNMFDWAAMDCPYNGVVTHINCLLSKALYQNSQLLLQYNDDAFAEMLEYSKKISKAINAHLWNDKKQAYVDCIRYVDGKKVKSEVYSQQTQTVAYLAGVATTEQKQIIKDYIIKAPDSFVKAGSPFFEFFKLEVLMELGLQKEFLDEILVNWGFMADAGCDTVWEMWSEKLPNGRLTRSHCHGWSGAPAYVLPEYILGVRPLTPGYKTAIIDIHTCGLKWCRGAVGTPFGKILVSWEADKKNVYLKYCAPKQIQLSFNCDNKQIIFK